MEKKINSRVVGGHTIYSEWPLMGGEASGFVHKDFIIPKTGVKEGDKFKIGKDRYMVRIDNKHKWFYVNEDIYELYRELIGKNVVITGGADFECLEDIYTSMNSFGVHPVYNHDYIYSAQTSNKQQSTINN